MNEETRRKALKKHIADAHTTREALEIARARIFELQAHVEAKASRADDMSEYNGLMAQRDGVGRAWTLLDDLLHELQEGE